MNEKLQIEESTVVSQTCLCAHNGEGGLEYGVQPTAGLNGK